MRAGLDLLPVSPRSVLLGGLVRVPVPVGICALVLGRRGPEAERGGRRVEEALLDGVQGAFGEEVDCVDDFVEEGL